GRNTVVRDVREVDRLGAVGVAGEVPRALEAVDVEGAAPVPVVARDRGRETGRVELQLHERASPAAPVESGRMRGRVCVAAWCATRVRPRAAVANGHAEPRCSRTPE